MERAATGLKLTTQTSDIFAPQEDFQRTCGETAEGSRTAKLNRYERLKYLWSEVPKQIDTTVEND